MHFVFDAVPWFTFVTSIVLITLISQLLYSLSCLGQGITKKLNYLCE